MATESTPQQPLSARLRALVVQHAGKAPLTCAFEGGGKHNGVGIASPLWCLTCGQARMWHDIGEGAALAASVEDSERLPFMRADDEAESYEAQFAKSLSFQEASES